MAGLISLHQRRAMVVTAPPQVFLASLFPTPADGYFDTEKVTIDIQYELDQLSVPVRSLASGARSIRADQYDETEMTPAVFRDKTEVGVHELLKPQFGENPYQTAMFQVHLAQIVGRRVSKLIPRIQRSISLMGAQLLQTGEIDMIDETGATVYTISYGLPSAHFADASFAWTDQTDGDPAGDLRAHAELLERNGKEKIDTVILGKTAGLNFVNHDKVKTQLDNRRMEMGRIAPRVGEGVADATYLGVINAGSRNFDVWMHDHTYRHPQTGADTPYVGVNNAILLASNARRETLYGSVPRVVPVDNRLAGLLPQRARADRSGGVDIHPYVYAAPNGSSATVEVASRPLVHCPNALTFGTLNTAP